MKKVIAINTVGGVCKTLFTRYGRLGWENFLGRMEHGGWDCQMTSIMEVYEEDSADKYNERGMCLRNQDGV